MNIGHQNKEHFDKAMHRINNHITKAEEIETLGYAKTALGKIHPTLWT